MMEEVSLHDKEIGFGFYTLYDRVLIKITEDLQLYFTENYINDESIDEFLYTSYGIL